MDNNKVRYGQIIRIAGDFGMIVSKGFTQQNVYFMTYIHLQKINNFRESLFQILPKGSFEIHDEFSKQSKELLLQRMTTELNQYLAFVESKLDEEVLFGQEVVLKHYDSEQYLQGSYKCSEHTTDAFCVRLMEHPSSHALFKIQPYHTYQKEGQVLYFDEPFTFVNIKQQFNVDYTDRHVTNYDDDEQLQFIRRPQDVQKYPIVITHNSKAYWRMKLYLNNRQRLEKKQIRPNDLIFLQSSKDGAYLTGEDVTLELRDAPQMIPLSSIWELQAITEGSKLKGNTRKSTFNILSMLPDAVKNDSKYCLDNKMDGSTQPVLRKSNNECILRHYLSGKVMTYCDGQPMLKHQMPGLTQQLEIIVTKVGQNELKQNAYVQIQCNREVLQNIDIQNQWEKNESDCEVSFEAGLRFADRESQHAFQIKKVPLSMKNNMLFVLSAQDSLYEFVIVLSRPIDEMMKAVTNIMLNNMIEVMNKLIKFLSDEVVIRQQCMKETYIIELLMKVLMQITDKNLLAMEFHQKKIKKLFKLTYELIKALTHNNKELKLHVSKWMEVFLHQAMVIDEERVQESLKELLDDNYDAIQKFITEESIDRVMDMMHNNPHEKYLKILCSICVCKGRSLVKNQNYVLRQILTNRVAFHFKFKTMNNKVLLYCYIGKEMPGWRTLKQFYQDSLDLDQHQSWNYFMGYIDLLAVLCHSRNRQAQEFVRDHLPITILLQLIEDPLSQQTKYIECFLKVIHLAFVDNINHLSKVVSRVIEWESSGVTDIASVQVCEELKNVMQFVQQFISQFTHFGYNITYNKTLLRVLKIIMTTLQLGFWQSISQLIAILHDLLRICSCQKDFEKLEEGLGEHANFKKAKHRMTKMNTENQIIMDCKMLACQIILGILDKENYVRINEMVHLFKQKLTQQVDEIDENVQNKSNLIKQILGHFTSYFKYAPLNTEAMANSFFKEAASTLIKQKDLIKEQAYKAQAWIDDIQGILERRNLFSGFPLNLMLIFVEISLFQNPKMVEMALQLLSRMFGQKKELVLQFSKIVLLSGKEQSIKELSQKAMQIRAKLEMLKDSNVYMINADNQSTYNVQISEIVEDLNILALALKTPILHSASSFLPIPFNEYEENEKMHQSLFRAFELHQTIINYIAGADNLNDFLQQLLFSSYNFLTLFIWNHVVNKVETQWPLQAMYAHLEFNCCCADFLRELFHNNKELLYNTNEVNKFVRCIVFQANKLDYSSYYKCKLLDILRVLQYDHNKTIKQNQLLTLSILQEKCHNNMMFVLNHLSPTFTLIKESRVDVSQHSNNLWDENDFLEWIELYGESYGKSNDTKLLVITPQLMYMVIYFEIFSLLVEDKNMINAEKCRAMHPYASLIALMRRIYMYDCWPLQHFVRSYLNRLYYNEELEGITSMIFQYDLDTLLHELQQIIKVKEGTEYRKIQIQDGIRFQYLFSHIFGCLQEILYSLNLILVNDHFLNELEEQLLKNEYTLHVQLFKIAGCLVQIERLWFKSNYVANFCKVLINIFRCIFKSFQLDDLKQIEELLSDEISEAGTPVTPAKLKKNSAKLKDESERLIDKLLHYREIAMGDEQLQVSNLQHHLKRMFHLKSMKKLNVSTQDDDKELKIKHNKLVSHLNENTAFQIAQEEEFNQLCEQLNFIDEISMKAYQSPVPVITLKEFIKNMIQMNINDQLNDSVRTFFLKMLVRIISEKNAQQDHQLSIDEWSPDFWSDSKKQIEDVQNFLDECGAASLIFMMFKEDLQDKWALFNQLLIFANAFLLGGNTKCQNSLLTLLKQDQSNQMMTNLQSLIIKFSKFVFSTFKIKKNKQKQQQNPLLSIVYLDNLTTFNDQSDTLKRVLPSAMESQESIQNKQMSKQIISRAFRMLQLLCENNNVQMKNYLREQTDKEDMVHMNSINFIEFATKELRILLKILNRNVIQITSQIVDFINEVIQLPCQLNQVTLCKSTFFEDVCFTSELFTKKQFQKLRDLDQPAQVEQLFELQGKIIQSIMLVLEGNDARNYEDLQSKLDPKFLAGFIRTILQNMGVNSSKELSFMKEPRFPQEILEMLNVFIIKEKIEYHVQDSKWLRHFKNEFEGDPLLKDIQCFCLKNLRQIEIYYEDEPQMVFFPSNPVFDFLSSETKDKIMFIIPRDTQREKLISLLGQMDNIFREISYSFKLNWWPIRITHPIISRMTNIAQLLSLMINIAMILAYDVMIKDKQSTLVTDYKEDLFLSVLSYSQLFFSVTAMIYYTISRAPLEFKKLKQEPFSWKRLHIYSLNTLGNSLTVFKGDDFLSHLSYCSISLLATMTNTYYFSLHLFYLFGRLALLKNVFQAISYNATQLGMVALLGVLFQFVFSLVGFNNYVDDIYPEEPEDPCHSVVSCMITLMTSGVIGTSMSSWDPLKFIYDTVYFVFFALLFTNIISGIMIDTFAELRDQRKLIDDDKKNNCFICGIDRQTLEKNQEDFDQHINSKHFLWNYVFYLYCLFNKDSTEYTGLEYWIMDKVEKESTSWFPVVSVEKDDLSNQFDQVLKKLDLVLGELQQQQQ